MKVYEVLNKYGRNVGSYLLECFAGISPEETVFRLREKLDPEEEESLCRAADKLDEFPVQYITGFSYFYGRKFIVDENVLIPRFDSETLIDAVIRSGKRGTILDLCTGSGILGITLNLETGQPADLSDISQKALDIAGVNAKRHGCNVRLIHSDLFDKITGKYDIIVSNPPYINREDMNRLDLEVKKEPASALFGGNDGLDFYRTITKDASGYLNPGGYLFLEIGYDQEKSVKELLKQNFHDIKSYKDVSGTVRVLSAKLKNKEV